MATRGKKWWEGLGIGLGLVTRTQPMLAKLNNTFSQGVGILCRLSS